VCYLCAPFHIVNLLEVRDLGISMLAQSLAEVINMVSCFKLACTIHRLFLCLFHVHGVGNASSLVS
jgi:hypothetical protein